MTLSFLLYCRVYWLLLFDNDACYLVTTGWNQFWSRVPFLATSAFTRLLMIIIKITYKLKKVDILWKRRRIRVELQKAGLKCLNEAVACITAVTVRKSKKFMDLLGPSLKCIRSITSKDICLVRIWNAVQDASTVGVAQALSQKWANKSPDEQLPLWLQLPLHLNSNSIEHHV